MVAVEVHSAHEKCLQMLERKKEGRKDREGRKERGKEGERRGRKEERRRKVERKKERERKNQCWGMINQKLVCLFYMHFSGMN